MTDNSKNSKLSKFALVNLAAKRAKRLQRGAKPLVDTESSKPAIIALEEIRAGKIEYEFIKTEGRDGD